MKSDNPPLVKVRLTKVFEYYTYEFTLSRLALFSNAAYYGGAFATDDKAFAVGMDAHGTSAFFEVREIPESGGGTPIIDLGEVTLTEQSLGGISIATAGNITVSAEQATLAQANNPPIVKIRFDNDDYEFFRTKISTDASAAYVSFTATEETGERSKFYNLQITISLTGGSASASLLMLEYRLVSSIINPLNLGNVTFADGVATITLTGEQNTVIGAVNALQFTKAGTGEIYWLYRSQLKSGGASAAHDSDFFGIVSGADGLTAYAAYVDGTTLTIKQITIANT